MLPTGATTTRIPSWMTRWSEIEAHIAARPRLLLALGFDGIISPTTASPDDTTLPEGTRSLLMKLGASSRISLAFASGRPVHAIQARVGLDNAFYAGNHGMEIRGPGLASYDGLAVSCRSDLVDALVFLTKWTKRLRGAHVEDKGLTIMVHWNRNDPSEGAVLGELLSIIVKSHPRLSFISGRGVSEVRPRAAWNKGNALQQILANLHLTPADTIYIGDEFTDEDAFTHLSSGLTFCVGNSATAARYRLANTSDAAALLFCLLCNVNGMTLT